MFSGITGIINVHMITLYIKQSHCIMHRFLRDVYKSLNALLFIVSFKYPESIPNSDTFLSLER